ncbi:MAG: hypothetical protein EPO07_18135, partial [Verrucomicrobia bacterium]
MSLKDRVAAWLRPPLLSRGRIGLALAVAAAADGLQLASLPLAWVFVPEIIDVIAMALLMCVLGFHYLLLPTFALELLPLLDALPTWTGCVIVVIALLPPTQR